MAKANKFEEMLERLVNEDKAGAEELFHEIVVERSREIYENLLAEDEEEVDEANDEEVDESEDDLDEAADEEVDESEDELDEAADEEVEESDEDDLDESFFDEMGGDPADDMMGDVEMPGADEMGAEDPEMGMGSEDDDLEDRVMDLEDELAQLQAEFEAMMGDEAGDDEGDDEMDMDMDMDDEGDDEMPMDMDSEEGDEEEEAEEESTEEAVEKSETETMREYVEKVTAKMGDDGAADGKKSTVASKNDMGGSAASIARNDVANDPEAGAGKKVAGSALSDTSAKEDSHGNVNVPGAKAATKMAATPGHGAEKKGKPETADKGAGSTIKGK